MSQEKLLVTKVSFLSQKDYFLKQREFVLSQEIQLKSHEKLRTPSVKGRIFPVIANITQVTGRTKRKNISWRSTACLILKRCGRANGPPRIKNGHMVAVVRASPKQATHTTAV